MPGDPLASIDAAKQAFMRDIRAAMTRAVDESAKLLLEEMRVLTSRIDHSLQDLARLGHPYRQKAPPGVPHPDWIVHIQSGKLREGLKRRPTQVSTLTVKAEIISESPYTWYLLLGTRKMRPRDFVSAALQLRRRQVETIFEHYFLAVHDGPGPLGQAVDVRLIEHPEYPAQLPGEV